MAIDKAIEFKTDNLEFAWINKGSALRLLHRHTEALEAYNEALRLNPESAHAWYNKGAMLQVLDRPVESQYAFDRARRLGLNF